MTAAIVLNKLKINTQDPPEEITLPNTNGPPIQWPRQDEPAEIRGALTNVTATPTDWFPNWRQLCALLMDESMKISEKLTLTLRQWRFEQKLDARKGYRPTI